MKLAKDYEQQGLQVVAISSNSVETHPQDGPEHMADDARTLGSNHAALRKSQQQADTCCTPHGMVQPDLRAR